MRKIIFLLAIIIFPLTTLFAQVHEPGIPLSMQQAYKIELSLQTYIPLFSYSAININTLLSEDSTNFLPHPGLFRIGVLTPADISFPSSGSIVTLEDGRKVWRAQVQLNGSPALGFYYDRFYLPAGVRYFISNANGSQVLGAFTSNNNTDDGSWANEKIQGEIANLEMDIDANVDLSTIRMHINNAGVFYKAISYLKPYSLAPSGIYFKTTGGPYFPYDSSSACEKNAICDPYGYPNERKASVHIEYIAKGFLYAGSGVMVNNVNNDCTPYILTATHVEPTNSTASATFSTWIFYFNYETPTCAYTGTAPIPSTITGATFNTRASFDSSSSTIVGDYLLLQLSKSPGDYGAYLAGWDTSDAITSGTFVSFHHPNGDVKKISETGTANPNASFNRKPLGPVDTHWGVLWAYGGTEEGSSGGGLFNSAHHLIGLLSGGSNSSATCTSKNNSGQVMSDNGVYSKLSIDWNYQYQPSSFSVPSLRSFLDPGNTRTVILDGLAACPTAVPIIPNGANTLSIYPNPSNGIYNITGIADNSKIEIYNSIGQLIQDLHVVKTGSLTYKIDLDQYQQGIYMLRIITGGNVQTGKLILK